jgi:DNA (cytosine-5)-methyltransferase 1
VRTVSFAGICEREAPCDPQAKTRRLMTMLSAANRNKLDTAMRAEKFFAGTGYRRTRSGVQRLELRFDGVAGCLRTPNGGSSRQIALLGEGGKLRSRLMTVRECARLMGAPDSYRVPGTYNDGYRAMGDAVAVPVTRWLARHLLAPLAALARSTGHERRTHAGTTQQLHARGEVAGYEPGDAGAADRA